MKHLHLPLEELTECIDSGSATVFKGAFHIQQKYLGPAVRRFADLFINHQWSKRLTTLHVSGDSATAHFDDGTFCHADIVVGCDGIHSSVRKMCFPSRHRNYELPVRMLGVGVPYSTDQVAEIRKLDPFFLHGSDSRSDVYLWFSCTSSGCQATTHASIKALTPMQFLKCRQPMPTPQSHTFAKF